VLAILFAYFGMGVEWVAISGIIGEFIALYVSFHLLVIPEFKKRLIKIALSMSGYLLVITVIVELISEEIMFTNVILHNIYLMLAGGVAGVIVAAGLCLINKTAREQIYHLLSSLLNIRKTAS